MRKPIFCICENKGADQLRSNCEADMHYILFSLHVYFLYFPNPKLTSSTTAQFALDLLGNHIVGFLMTWHKCD